MSYAFGKGSKERLLTCHEDLIRVAEKALSLSHIDFSITEGERTLERQKELFDKGRSKIDGINKKGKHNHSPSLAFDFMVYVPGRKDLAFDKEHLTYIAGIIMAVGAEMFATQKIKHELRWGGNFDRDGIILLDQVLWDRPHIELIGVDIDG